MAVIVNAQFQVVIGQDVTEVYDVLAKSVTVGGAVDVKEPVKTKKGFKKYASGYPEYSRFGIFTEDCKQRRFFELRCAHAS